MRICMYDLGTNIGVFKRYDTETNAKLHLTTYCRVYSIGSETKSELESSFNYASGGRAYPIDLLPIKMIVA